MLSKWCAFSGLCHSSKDQKVLKSAGCFIVVKYMQGINNRTSSRLAVEQDINCTSFNSIRNLFLLNSKREIHQTEPSRLESPREDHSPRSRAIDPSHVPCTGDRNQRG